MAEFDHNDAKIESGGTLEILSAEDIKNQFYDWMELKSNTHNDCSFGIVNGAVQQLLNVHDKGHDKMHEKGHEKHSKSHDRSHDKAVPY